MYVKKYKYSITFYWKYKKYKLTKETKSITKFVYLI